MGLGIGSLVSGAGNLIGMGMANDSANTGMADYAQYAQQGTNQLNQGMVQGRADWYPYTGAGQQGVANLTSGIANRQQATQPTVTTQNGQNAMNYLNPSAAYSTDQASKGLAASGIASGGVGGGLAKAISNNANQMAMTNYNNAYNQMLQSNQMTNQQQQQNYQNQTNYDQSQINNWQNVANMGANATGNLTNQNQAYNSGINQNYQNLGQTAWNTNMAKAANYNSGINNAFSNFGSSVEEASPTSQIGQNAGSIGSLFGGIASII